MKVVLKEQLFLFVKEILARLGCSESGLKIDVFPWRSEDRLKRGIVSLSKGVPRKAGLL